MSKNYRERNLRERERESQLFRTIFKINIPKILKKQRESETLSNTFNLIESQRERIEGK